MYDIGWLRRCQCHSGPTPDFNPRVPILSVYNHVGHMLLWTQFTQARVTFALQCFSFIQVFEGESGGGPRKVMSCKVVMLFQGPFP